MGGYAVEFYGALSRRRFWHRGRMGLPAVRAWHGRASGLLPWAALPTLPIRPMDQRCGIDAEGFILTPSQAPFQRPFQAALQAACHLLPVHLGERLDSLYVYGSVAEGHATPGISDLDLCVILRQPSSPQDLATLTRLQQHLQAHHPVVSKVDIDIGALPEVLAPDQHLRWGYWLTHHCRWLWGHDRIRGFARCRPSRAIALAVNGDFATVLADYAARIADATGAADCQRLQREAARKLIRASSVLRSADEPCWPQTLADHAALLQQQYPHQADALAYFLAQARAPTPDAQSFTQRLTAFVQWMQHTLAFVPQNTHSSSLHR
jgi:predicted nucleotidyltransferase